MGITEIAPMEQPVFSLSAMPAMSIQQAVERFKALGQFVRTIMAEGVDFGRIAGTDKPTLLKPGAEKLSTFFGLHPAFELVQRVEDWSGQEHDGEPFLYYLYKCRLTHAGEIIAEGDGSCNSHESKYRYRKADRICPQCGQPTIFKSKQKPEWYCWAKKGGCGATYPLGDKRIEGQETGRVLNPDVADQANTILKMAQKRALIAAVLIGVNASEYFTQDLEDMPGFGEVIEGTATVVSEPKSQPATSAPASAQPAKEPASPATGSPEPSAAKPARPWTSAQVVAAIRSTAEYGAAHPDKVEVNGRYAAMLGLLDKITKEGDHHVFLRAIWGIESAKDLLPERKWALVKWADPFKATADDPWQLPQHACVEFTRVVMDTLHTDEVPF